MTQTALNRQKDMAVNRYHSTYSDALLTHTYLAKVQKIQRVDDLRFPYWEFLKPFGRSIIIPATPETRELHFSAGEEDFKCLTC